MNIDDNQIKQKLKDTSGVTIIFALITFLLVAMVSAVVVNTALGNAQRHRESIRQNQAYYSAESAAKMLKTMVGENQLEYHVTVVEVENEVTSDEGWTNISGAEKGVTSATVAVDTAEVMDNPVVSAVNSIIGDDVEARYASGTSSGSEIPSEGITRSFSVTAAVEGETESPFDKVKADLTIDNEYNLKITVSIDPEGASDKVYTNRMILEAKGHEIENGIDTVESEPEEALAPGTGEDLGYSSRTVTTTTHYLIEWDNIRIIKDPVSAGGSVG